MSKDSVLLVNRRRILYFGVAGAGSTLLAGCAGMGGLASSLMGGGEQVDWTTLGNEFAGHLANIAAQTGGLIEIQEMYASTLGMKDQAANLRVAAENMRKGNPTGAAELDEQINVTRNTANAVADRLREARGIDSAQKRKLAEGQERHAQAIRNMWGGVIGTGLTLARATNAKPPSIGDIALFNTFKEITQTGPLAMAFGETSEATYKQYAAAFEYAGVPVTPAMVLDLPSLS